MEPDALHPDDAAAQLAGVELLSVMSGSIPDMKSLRDRCLAAGIPALIGCPGGGRSCGAKTHLLVSETAIMQVNQLFADTWGADLAREGLAPVRYHASDVELAPDEEPPCPACGTAAPLVDGCCSDCGLALEG